MLDSVKVFKANPKDDVRDCGGVHTAGKVAQAVWWLELCFAVMLGACGYSVAGFWHMTGVL